MRLEKGVPSEELHEDATDTPDIAGETPAQIQDDLRGPIVSSGHHRRVILIIERG